MPSLNAYYLISLCPMCDCVQKDANRKTCKKCGHSTIKLEQASPNFHFAIDHLKAYGHLSDHEAVMVENRLYKVVD